MRIKGLFEDRPFLFQILTLLFLIMIGGIVSSLLGLGIFSILFGTDSNLMNNPEMLRLIQFISAIGTFLAPALLMAFLCSHHPIEYLYIKRFPNLRIIFLTILSVILISPAISLTGILNKMIELPAFLRPVEEWMQIKEGEAERLTNIMLSGNGFITLLQNILVVAVIASITEEFVFRGTLKQLFNKFTSNQHLIIWAAAVFFSVFHMQFYGFIPRMLLGAFFGYLLLWGNNIWVPVIAHFTNNLLGVVSMTNPRLSGNEFISGNVSDANMLPYSFAAAVFTIFFYYCCKILKKELIKS